MAGIPHAFSAFRIHRDDEGYRAGVESLRLDDLNPGEVVIKAHYSSVNYKDALAGTGEGKILRHFPLVGGIDVAGEVVSSEDDRFSPGDLVLVTGCGLSETRDGGYSEYVRAEHQWVVPLPDGLTTREAMILGTAGFTAALCLYRMECSGQNPANGPIVVTGATGGVGMLAINMLHHAGYEVHAITGKEDSFELLQALGASSCISRKGLHWGQRPLESARWAGAIDSVGGEMLEGLTRVIEPWGNIASCGMAGGMELHTTVMPFIIRGIGLLGINSAGCRYTLRETLWDKLASTWKPPALDLIQQRETDLQGLPKIFEIMLKGQSFGRTLVTIAP